MLALIISLSVVAFLILSWILICYLIYRGIFKSPNKEQIKAGELTDPTNFYAGFPEVDELLKIMENTSFEEVHTNSYDGLRLRGRIFLQDENAPFILCFHGYRGAPLRDFCGGFQIMKEYGLNILLVDERSHVGSEGHAITFGVKERRDVLSWVSYINMRFPNHKIILSGISMGAATVLMAAELDLPSNVVGVTADCPFSSPKSIFKTTCKEVLHIPLFIGMPAVFTAALFAKFYSFAANTVKNAYKIKIPIVIFHGEDDTIVPAKLSKEVADANKKMITRYTFPGANHGVSYLRDPKRYKDITFKFFDSILK